jgi:hypothetical protein
MSINQERYKNYLKEKSAQCFDKVFTIVKEGNITPEKEECIHRLIGQGSMFDIMDAFMPENFNNMNCYREFIEGMHDGLFDVDSYLEAAAERESVS